MSELAAKGKSRGTIGSDERDKNSGLPNLRVRYFRQMKHQRVYSVEVFWQKSSQPVSGEVTVRLLGAGAQILPAEQALDSSQPEAKAVFYVTPLARGWLRNQKVEVLSHGRKIQEIPLATKVVSQRLTWVLLLCTLFVPWFITEFLKRSPIDNVQRNAQGTITTKAIAVEVKDYIKDNVPALPSVKKTAVETGLLDFRDFLGKAYQQIVQVARIEPIAFYAGFVLLGLTLISCFLHRTKRGQTSGKPLVVATAGGIDGGTG